MIGKLFWFFVGTIIYAYAGYPALLGLLAKLKRRELPDEAITPDVTLLIAAYNEEATIASKLENSLQLDYPKDKLQILVAADGSNDRTPEIVKQFADRGIELSYSPPRRGKMAAINRAMPQARGKIVVFSDANNVYAPDTIREIVKPFSDPEVGAASGAKSIMQGDGALGDSEGLYWKYESYIKTQETHLGSCTGVVGELFAIRRDLFESPPDKVINDDFYMAMQLIQRGYRVVYCPQARSAERVSISPQDEVARRARIVAGRYQAVDLLPWDRPLVAWQIVSHKLLRPLVPLAMLGALLTNLAAVAVLRKQKSRSLGSLTPPFDKILLAMQIAFYGLSWLGNKVELKGSVGKILYLPTFLVNSNMAALIGLYRFATKRQTTLWQRAARREEILASSLNGKSSATSTTPAWEEKK